MESFEADVLPAARVEELLRESGALLEGHFLLASGRHSAQYIEKFRLLEQPHLTSLLCGEIARRFANSRIECVAGPVTGGIILAFEVARQLGCRAVYAERAEDGRGFVLRRGFQLKPDERILVVEDIVTTGGSLRQVVETVRRAGGNVQGAALLVDRSDGATAELAPDIARVEALLKLQIESYVPDAVPPELAARGAAMKPGSSVI